VAAARNDDAKAEVLVITGELADLAEATIADARAVAVNARRALKRRRAPGSGRTARALTDIDTVTARLEAIIAQTRLRVAGGVPDGATRVVSLHDPDARPIRQGRLGRPVEFGYKARVADNADGIVIDHTVTVGNPPDAPMVAPAIARIKTRFTHPPRRSPPIGATGRAPSTPPWSRSAWRSWPSPGGVGPDRPEPPRSGPRSS